MIGHHWSGDPNNAGNVMFQTTATSTATTSPMATTSARPNRVDHTAHDVETDVGASGLTRRLERVVLLANFAAAALDQHDAATSARLPRPAPLRYQVDNPAGRGGLAESRRAADLQRRHALVKVG